MREEFDFDVALAALQDGQGLTGKDGILTPLYQRHQFLTLWGFPNRF